MMKPIEKLFPDAADPEMIRRAYILGYRTGYEDGLQQSVDASRTAYNDESFLNIPIEAMRLTTRAYNCLVRNGFRYVGDVAKASAEQIRFMHNMGKTTETEITQALKRLGITDTDWEYAWMLKY